MKTILRNVCKSIESDLAEDPTLIVNEAELQAMIQIELLKTLNEMVETKLLQGTLRRSHHPILKVPRVYRELKPQGSRSGKEADILILKNETQYIEPKENGAPARFKGPFAAIVETKIDTDWDRLCTGRYGAPKASALNNDLEKWQQYEIEGRVDEVFCIVLTPRPEIYDGMESVITIRHSPDNLIDWDEGDVVNCQSKDAWQTSQNALLETYVFYSAHPVGMLREKDFETRIFNYIRENFQGRSKLRLSNGRIISMNSVRTQFVGEWSKTINKKRRHDIIIMRPNGEGAIVELELKTSHSDSHNWYRKAEVAEEYNNISSLIGNGSLDFGAFVMFRYGKAFQGWEVDRIALEKKFPKVQSYYFCA